MATADPVARHYGRTGIVERVLAALRDASGPGVPITPDTLAPLDHFHGRGVAATADLAELLKPQPGERLLDIGSGIGGPARWMSAKYDVHVTGVDLTPEFCEAARALNAACGLADRVTIVEGSALDLPVPDGAFDRAYSQNVVMNIADKRRFYREAFRALRPGGVLALSNVCAGPAGPPYFPVPWAETAATSFLDSLEEMRPVLKLPASRSSTSRIPAPRSFRFSAASGSGSSAKARRRWACMSCSATACGRCRSIRRAASKTGGRERSRRWSGSRAEDRPPRRRPAQRPERDNAAGIGRDR